MIANLRLICTIIELLVGESPFNDHCARISNEQCICTYAKGIDTYLLGPGVFILNGKKAGLEDLLALCGSYFRGRNNDDAGFGGSGDRCPYWENVNDAGCKMLLVFTALCVTYLRVK